ncbi:hypothetical protein OG884_09940 [Streptosporangium sp. NBC_01755]|uniref:hypothetical protein n=1 Tax=unclassified Streptosporangium TaxID=2632669 RepID=UPI002DD8FA9E|nr:MULTISPECIES: hypothetical protein [unclassified Streptosporangium]WSA26363.1 hypothetical protein OIE13_00180 [Streptosporangium sp. NBC_01810]WSD02208.1 hypothetical protein OG884_09940 [Streptosporangium sp. NBC_01755]
MSNRPMTLTVAAAVMAVEGATALLLGGYVGVETVIGRPSDLMTSIAVAVFGIIIGAALLWVGWGMIQAERWARSPGVLTQIFAIPVSVTLIQSDQLVIGISLITLVVIGLVTLLSPPTTHALYGDQE